MSTILKAIRDESLKLSRKEEELWKQVNAFCEEVEQNRKLFAMAGGDPADLNGLGDRLSVKPTSTAVTKPIKVRQRKWRTLDKYAGFTLAHAASRIFREHGPLNLGQLALHLFGYSENTAANERAKRRLSVLMSETKKNGRKWFGRKPGTRYWDNR